MWAFRNEYLSRKYEIIPVTIGEEAKPMKCLAAASERRVRLCTTMSASPAQTTEWYRGSSEFNETSYAAEREL